MASRKRKKFQQTEQQIDIGSLAHDGRGVGRLETGEVVFVDFALPGERVLARLLMRRKQVLIGTTLQVLKASKHRIEPRCKVFGQCGGCVLQQLDSAVQIHYKQQQLLENLKKIGGVEPENVLAPVTGDQWGYRRRARLGVKYVPKKGGTIIGFRERNSSFIQPTVNCDVLHPQVAGLIPVLRETIDGLSCRDRIPQVEVTVADNAIVFIMRHLQAFTEHDLGQLRQFAKRSEIQLFLQPGNLESIYPLYPQSPVPLYYELAKFNLKLGFTATDFIQVNAEINQKMIELAVNELAITEKDRVLDLFCGVGNFSLAIARHAGQVVGVEGDAALVKRAQHNVRLNQINNAEFFCADLFAEQVNTNQSDIWLTQRFDQILLDPPRSGALEVVKRIADFKAKKIVYVSCNPSTLARDASILVKQHGYRLVKAGVIDMFPHTAHVESIAIFENH